VIFSLQCAVVANSRVIQTALYHHLTILRAVVALRYMVTSAILVSSHLVSRYLSMYRRYRTALLLLLLSSWSRVILCSLINFEHRSYRILINKWVHQIVPKCSPVLCCTLHTQSVHIVYAKPHLLCFKSDDGKILKFCTMQPPVHVSKMMCDIVDRKGWILELFW